MKSRLISIGSFLKNKKQKSKKFIFLKNMLNFGLSSSVPIIKKHNTKSTKAFNINTNITVLSNNYKKKIFFKNSNNLSKIKFNIKSQQKLSNSYKFTNKKTNITNFNNFYNTNIKLKLNNQNNNVKIVKTYDHNYIKKENDNAINNKLKTIIESKYKNENIFNNYKTNYNNLNITSINNLDDCDNNNNNASLDNFNNKKKSFIDVAKHVMTLNKITRIFSSKTNFDLYQENKDKVKFSLKHNKIIFGKYKSRWMDIIDNLLTNDTISCEDLTTYYELKEIRLINIMKLETDTECDNIVRNILFKIKFDIKKDIDIFKN